MYEVLEEIVFTVQAQLIETPLPFCAFNGGADVFVDVGNKSLGLEALMNYLNLRPPQVDSLLRKRKLSKNIWLPLRHSSLSLVKMSGTLMLYTWHSISLLMRESAALVIKRRQLFVSINRYLNLKSRSETEWACWRKTWWRLVLLDKHLPDFSLYSTCLVISSASQPCMTWPRLFQQIIMSAYWRFMAIQRLITRNNVHVISSRSPNIRSPWQISLVIL